MYKRDEEKAKYERQVFDLFAHAAQLDIAAGSVVQGKPPAPDIVCIMDGQQRAFELTALTDPAIEHKVLGSKKDPSLGEYSTYRITVADVVARVEKKERATYSVESVELLLHSAALPLDDLKIQQADFEAALTQLAAASRFSCIWVFDYFDSTVRAYRRSR